MNKIIIGLGNTGSVIVRDLSNKKLTDVKLFAIDSQTKVILDDVNKVECIPIVADDNVGSGRDRERGRAMFEYNDSHNALDNLYAVCENTDTIFVITSAAGGTGSGSCPALCEKLLKRFAYTKVIPVIVVPNMSDPDAYHYNTNDLMYELNNIKVDGVPGVGPYMIFRNPDSSDYEKINKEIVSAIEVLLGTHYEPTDNDSIDASDLNNILSTVGRLMAISVSGETIDEVHKKVLREIVSSYQPTWNADDVRHSVAAISMKSINAGEDSKIIENDIMTKLNHCSDRYKNIVIDDNNGMVDVTLIIAGLPPVELKKIDTEYSETAGIGENLKKTERPAFMKRRHIAFRPIATKLADTPEQEESKK